MNTFFRVYRRNYSLLILVAGLYLGALFMTGQARAADDLTAGALKLYEKHHYEEAVRMLRPEWAKMEGSRQAAASLALGMIHLSSAMLYRELHQTAVLIELDYLAQLNRQKAGSSSRYADFYLGQALLQVGKPAESIASLQRFADKAGAQTPYKVFADIEMGIAYSRLKQTQKAAQKWSAADISKPEIKAALAGAYAAAGAQQHQPVALADAALTDAIKLHYTPSMRMLRNLLRAYSQAGAADKALDLLSTNEFKEASYVENLGATKSISFYDSSLLDDMAKIHLLAAVKYLEQANRDEKLSGTSSYYLADAYLQQGNAELSLHAVARFMTEEKSPPQYRDYAQILQAIAFGKTGQRAESAAIWQSLAARTAENPALLAALIQACTPARADCAKVEKLALAAVEKGEGKKFFSLNAALGKYYLLQKDYPKAVLYMEAGRDKAYKNKIEVNDPLMLTGLAEAYYRNKKFSENLEIYFEIAKQYPVVRQIQETMQGIYAMEQQSAGEVKIF